MSTPKIGCGKIYKMYVDNSDMVYIGSTFEKYVSDRLKMHRKDYKRYKVGKTNFVTSFKLFDITDDVQILELERYEDITKAEIKKYELNQILNHPTAVNKFKPQNIESNGDLNQWRKEYRELRTEKMKEYYYINKDKIKEQKTEYYKTNKEKFSNKNKDYYQLNKDKLKEKNKEYRELNKDKIHIKRNEKFNCEICGGKYTFSNKKQHLKSQKHQKAINQ